MFIERPPILENYFCKHSPPSEAAEAFWKMHKERGGGALYVVGSYAWHWDIQNDYGRKLCSFHIWGWDLV
jgi:hypothetical protein